MTMQRRHFELIAETLSLSKPGPFASEDAKAQHFFTVMTLTARLALTNPNFDRAKFLAACGVED